MGVDVGLALAKRNGRHELEEGRDDGHAEAGASAKAGVGDTNRGATDRAQKTPSHGDHPVDGEHPAVVQDGPGHKPAGESVAVHADEREMRDGAAGAERPAAVDVRRDGELGWREERVVGNHGPADGFNRRRAGETLDK